VSAPSDDHLGDLRAALAPLLAAVGARVVEAAHAVAGDVPIEWGGTAQFFVRLPNAEGTLHRLIDQVEDELGGALHELSRSDKQKAVRLLDERGAFTLRRSVEEVADAFGVSRITIYNYLNAIRARP
jgi:hypothetical protein